MTFVGIDLHKHSITLFVLDPRRTLLQTGRFACAWVDCIVACFAGLGPFQTTVEATAGYEWLLQRIGTLAQRVVLAHPGKLRIIAESTRKSDKLDARVLAEFLALDMIPPAYRPTPRQREHRAFGPAPPVSPETEDRAPRQGPADPQRLQRRPQGPLQQAGP